MNDFFIQSFITYLVRKELITKETQKEILHILSGTLSFNVIEYLLKINLVKEDELTSIVSDFFHSNTKKENYKKFQLENLLIIKEKHILFDVFPKEKIIKEKILPVLFDDGFCYVLTNNPFNMNVDNVIKILEEKHNIHNVKVGISGFYALEHKLENLLDNKINELLSSEEIEDIIKLENQEEESNDDFSIDSVKNDAPMNRLMNSILFECVKQDASDIHIESFETKLRIRFRVDGVLKVFATHPKTIERKLISVFKIKSGCDISERRIPQDGRIKIKFNIKKSIDFRVSFLPSLFGEKIVLRKLDASSAQMGIESLGYEEEQKNLYLEALNKPQGMILVTGPTGSGKTVSLYTGLNIINTEDVNISTAEDPVEINLFGINQVQINNKQGLGFPEVLRAFLRQDPDVIMVGEIRDLETAEIAIKAAQTGHMVMSTLHTNSAAETLTRLINMGVPAFNIATTVNLIIAQRLARKLCNKCKVKTELPEKILLESGFTREDIEKGFDIYEAHQEGCESCNHGFKGRVGIYEVMKITKKISSAIMNEANSLQIRDIQEEEGFNTLRRSALMKVISGVTSLTEINRITQD